MLESIPEAGSKASMDVLNKKEGEGSVSQVCSLPTERRSKAILDSIGNCPLLFIKFLVKFGQIWS